ncbi:oxidoreductase [Aureococcus anophagefferens]|nr:oxidoreductase [Aureococcus anophagefferens]
MPDLVMGIGCNKWGTDPAKFDAGALEATYVAALDAGALVASLRASLDALGAAKVDGFLVHFPRGDLAALADGLAAAVGAGLVDHVGCSNFGERALRRLHGLLGGGNCGAASFRLSKAEVVALDAYALDGEGFYRDPDAILCFLGLRPARLLRPLLAALVRVALFVAAALLPLQPDGA